MSKKTSPDDFLREWTASNAAPTNSDSVATARSLASKCFAEATNRGVDVDDLSEAAGGDLEAYLTKALSKGDRVAP
jgi:hypothetical protein